MQIYIYIYTYTLEYIVLLVCQSLGSYILPLVQDPGGTFLVVSCCHLKNEEVHMGCSSGDCDRCYGWDSLSSDISNVKLSS